MGGHQVPNSAGKDATRATFLGLEEDDHKNCLAPTYFLRCQHSDIPCSCIRRSLQRTYYRAHPRGSRDRGPSSPQTRLRKCRSGGWCAPHLVVYLTQRPRQTSRRQTSLNTHHSRTLHPYTASQMPHEVTDEVTLEELKFLRPVNKSKYSQIFQVEWRGQICALKVVSETRDLFRTNHAANANANMTLPSIMARFQTPTKSAQWTFLPANQLRTVVSKKKASAQRASCPTFMERSPT